MDPNAIKVVSGVIGFIAYLFVGLRVLRSVQVQEGGESVIYLIPAAAVGIAVAFVLYFGIMSFVR